MGWWKIKSVRTGQVDFNANKHRKGIKHANVIPGDKEHSKFLVNGDLPADIMGDSFDMICAIYLFTWKRLPKQDELLAIFNFCFNNLYDLKNMKMRLSQKSRNIIIEYLKKMTNDNKIATEDYNKILNEESELLYYPKRVKK